MEERLTTDQAVAGSSPATDAFLQAVTAQCLLQQKSATAGSRTRAAGLEGQNPDR